MSVLDVLSRGFSEKPKAAKAPAPAPAADALTLIHDDHEEVAALFETALSDSATPAVKRKAIDKICFSLTVHAKMEERIFYPALRKAGKKDEKDSVLEAAEEHGVVKDLIGKIKRIKGRDETLEAKVTVLKEMVEHHVKEEESTMFAEARKVLGRKLDALGAEMQAFKVRAGAAAPTESKPARKTPARPGAARKKTRKTS
jgi:hemerythrin-like domain-containing protein